MASEKQHAWNNSRSEWKPAQWQRSKLTTSQRTSIRARIEAGEDIGALALEFGVSAVTIRRVRAA